MKTITINSKTKISKKDYEFLRDKTIDNIMLNANNVYPNDDEMLLGIKALCNHLKEAKNSKISVDLVKGLAGFIYWSSMNFTKVTASLCLTNLIHDLGEFRKNKNADWFSPRTSSYAKYI